MQQKVCTMFYDSVTKQLGTARLKTSSVDVYYDG